MYKKREQCKKGEEFIAKPSILERYVVRIFCLTEKINNQKKKIGREEKKRICKRQEAILA
jgi:hypothetical protein